VSPTLPPEHVLSLSLSRVLLREGIEKATAAAAPCFRTEIERDELNVARERKRPPPERLSIRAFTVCRIACAVMSQP
jgi:hypothetical protein